MHLYYTRFNGYYFSDFDRQFDNVVIAIVCSSNLLQLPRAVIGGLDLV